MASRCPLPPTRLMSRQRHSSRLSMGSNRQSFSVVQARKLQSPTPDESTSWSMVSVQYHPLPTLSPVGCPVPLSCQSPLMETVDPSKAAAEVVVRPPSPSRVTRTDSEGSLRSIIVQCTATALLDPLGVTVSVHQSTPASSSAPHRSVKQISWA